MEKDKRLMEASEWERLTKGETGSCSDRFQIGKGVHQGCILSPCLFNLNGEYIRQNSGWMKYKPESRLLGEILIASDMQSIPEQKTGLKICSTWPAHQNKTQFPPQSVSPTRKLQ